MVCYYLLSDSIPFSLTPLIGKLESLKNVKKDVQEMKKGGECGIGFKGWTDFQIGDQIQAYEEKQEKRYL